MWCTDKWYTDKSRIRLIARGTLENFEKIFGWFFYSEGTNWRFKCNNCSNCNECCREMEITVKEEAERKLILKGLKHQENNKVWVAHYPWINYPYLRPNNFAATVMRVKETERRLEKLGDKSSKVYEEQIDNMVKRGVATKLIKDDIRCSGPVHCVSHHEMLKPDSISNPTRIVFNSIVSYNGHNLNHIEQRALMYQTTSLVYYLDLEKILLRLLGIFQRCLIV